VLRFLKYIDGWSNADGVLAWIFQLRMTGVATMTTDAAEGGMLHALVRVARAVDLYLLTVTWVSV